MLLWLISCTIQEKSHERDWLKEVLYADNWRYLQRSHQALVQKFTAMGESEYDFMRGSLSIQLAHWSRVSQDRASTNFLNTPDSTTVPAEGYLLVMTKVVLEDGSEIGFGLKKDGSETLFVTMFTDGWSVEVPESLGEDLSYARMPNGEFTWENGVVATQGAAN